ncbi:phosphate binding protein [Loigolactobacillus bifermentans DSM 20003]|uniref:Phosphate-binding protein n=2 Tax=Loigolactobacillus bifermentans TaxID=1607 RepID=A0A0R1GEM5_9LACO|nr:phosphate binding protein [Loigolactobacillus bifermentans DSM 20003]
MMKKGKIFSALIAVTITGGLLASCGSSNAKNASSAKASPTKITAVGSTALQPLVEQAAKDYQNKHSNVTINVQGGGSGTGLSQIQSGAVTIGNSDIFAAQQTGITASKLVDHRVAVVGMTPVVNRDVTVKNLTMAQLKAIFTGKVTNWKQVGGKDEKINVVNRAQGSGTRATFEAAVLKGAKALKAQEQDSNGTVQKIVSSTPGTISYLAFSYVNKNIKALSIDNVKPTATNVTTNKWQIWSYEHMYTKGQPNAATQKFLNYIDSKQVQNGLVQKLGYISVHDMQVTKNAAGTVKQQ